MHPMLFTHTIAISAIIALIFMMANCALSQSQDGSLWNYPAQSCRCHQSCKRQTLREQVCFAKRVLIIKTDGDNQQMTCPPAPTGGLTERMLSTCTARIERVVKAEFNLTRGPVTLLFAQSGPCALRSPLRAATAYLLIQCGRCKSTRVIRPMLAEDGTTATKPMEEQQPQPEIRPLPAMDEFPLDDFYEEEKWTMDGDMYNGGGSIFDTEYIRYAVPMPTQPVSILVSSCDTIVPLARVSDQALGTLFNPQCKLLGCQCGKKEVCQLVPRCVPLGCSCGLKSPCGKTPRKMIEEDTSAWD